MALTSFGIPAASMFNVTGQEIDLWELNLEMRFKQMFHEKIAAQLSYFARLRNV